MPPNDVSGLTSPSQPWKKHWPPQSKPSVGEKHGVPKGGLLLHDGSSGGAAEYARELDDDNAAAVATT